MIFKEKNTLTVTAHFKVGIIGTSCCDLRLFLPKEGLCTTETALAMNRYIGSALLPLLTRCAPLFAGTEHYASLIDSTLHTIYRLSKGRSLTKAQRDAIEECLLAVCK